MRRRGLSGAELGELLELYPRLVGPIRGLSMSGFLSRAELETLVVGSVGTGDLAPKAVGTGQLADAAVSPAKRYVRDVVALADAPAVLAAGELVDDGIFTITPTAGRALTTADAGDIVAAIPDVQVGTWFDIVIVCLAAFAATLTAGAGITIVGAAAVTNESGKFRAVVTNIGAGTEAVTFYRAA